MKPQLKKLLRRLTATVLLIVALLLIIVLNPILSYAGNTTHNNYTVFHNKTLDPALLTRLDDATVLLQTSEFYNPDLKLDICLNDGSVYPKLIRALRGQAFGFGFYNKVVIQGNAFYKDNYVELNGYKWNLTQLLAHEITHCLQYDHLGFWRSNPVANIPNWKWEGYAEYVSRHNIDQQDLATNIARYIAADKNKWEISFADNTIAPIEYYGYWILVQYCIDIKKMSYRQILADTASEEIIRKEMMDWFSKK